MGTRRRRKGFTQSRAEEIALELRDEVGVPFDGVLDPLLVAALLAVPVLTLHELVGVDRDIAFFTKGPGKGVFSAATIHLDRFRRGIIVNPAHSATRTVNSVCHEVGHLVLEHAPEAPLSLDHGRSWNGEQEKQADYLAGALLIPRDAAHQAARLGLTNAEVAAQFGVSVALATMRMNKTGARVREQRRRRALGVG
jgi:hypothetical protein